MITKIFDYGMNGEGVSKINGKVILIPNALLDEEIDIDIDEDHGNYATANINYICEDEFLKYQRDSYFVAKSDQRRLLLKLDNTLLSNNLEK